MGVYPIQMSVAQLSGGVVTILLDYTGGFGQVPEYALVIYQYNKTVRDQILKNATLSNQTLTNH